MGFLNALKRASDSTQDEMAWSSALFNSAQARSTSGSRPCTTPDSEYLIAI